MISKHYYTFNCLCISRSGVSPEDLPVYLHIHSGALQGTQSQYFRMKSTIPSARWKNCSSLSLILLKKGNSLDTPEHPAHINTIAIQRSTGSETVITLHSSSLQCPYSNSLILPLHCLSSCMLFKLEYEAIHGQ